MNNNIKNTRLPEYFSILENKTPKILYRVDSRAPEEVFQKGLSIDNETEFDFFQYFFNIYSVNNKKDLDCYINAFETPREAILNFRKNSFINSQGLKDLYIYVIRCDENFFSKEITRSSIAGALIENQLLSNNKNEINKLIFSFNDYGQKFTNNYEWFTVQKVNNNQIFSASHIKWDFKKSSSGAKNSTRVIANIEDTIFRNPNYFDLNTQANKRAFIYPEYLAQKSIEFKNEAYWFSHDDNLMTSVDFDMKSFSDNNIDSYISSKPIVKKFSLFDKESKNRIIKCNFYKEEMTKLFYENFMNKKRCLNYINKKNKPIELLFTYEKFFDKSVYLNVSNTKKRGIVFFVLKTKSKEEINKVYFDKLGRIIFDFNKESIPFALTLSNYDKSKDIIELDSLPACVNNINQNFYLEHAYSKIFYLKPSNEEYQHLELAIKHNNNSFVFLNPKKKYNFAYDLVNINLAKYSKKNQNFIFGTNTYTPELININLNWGWKDSLFKPNVFVTYNNEKNDLKIEQARSSESKTDNINILYSMNNLSILFIDYNNHYKLTTDIFSMMNKVDNTNSKYRWLEWEKGNLSTYPSKDSMWVLRKSRYDKDNLYWIINLFNNDYLWVQQKGENWGYFFLAKKDSKPAKSSCLFYLNESTIK